MRKLVDPDADFAWLVMSVVKAIRALALTVASPTALKTARSIRATSYAYEDLIFCVRSQMMSRRPWSRSPATRIAG